MRYGEDDSNNGEDPFFGEFSVYGADPQASAYRMPTAAPYAPPASLQPGVPQMTPDFIRQLQQGASTVGNAAQSGALSNMFAPGTLSPFDPLAEYAKTAPILSLKGNKEYENLNFQALPDTKYQLTVGGNVIGSAATPEQVAELVKQANAISAQGGKAVDVRLQKEVQAASRTGEPITAFEDVYANKENNNGFLDIAMPAALAAISGGALGPLLGGGFLGTGAAAGLGSVAGSLGTGDSLKNALIKGALTGVTAGALSGLGAAAPAASSATGSGAAGAGAAGAAVSSGAAPALGEIVVSATRPLLGSALSSGIGAGLGNIGSSLVQPDSFQRALDQARLDNEFGLGETVVSGSRIPDVNPGTGGIANIFSATESLGRAPDTMEEEATVTGRRYGDPDLGASLTVPVNAPATDTGYNVFAGDDPLIDVANKSTTDTKLGGALAVGGAGAGTLAATAGGTPPATTTATIQPGDDPLIDVAGKTITDPTLASTLAVGGAGALNLGTPTDLTLPGGDLADSVSEDPERGGGTLRTVLGGLTLLDLLSGALGGGGSGGTSVSAASRLNPIFSARLPGASPAFSQQSLAPRPGGVSGAPMTDIDWYRYGYNPERSFFNYVPATEAEREAMMVNPPSQLEQKARGGAMAVKKGGAPVKESFAVKGPGTGRSDEIPALLSDGEYVIDAETVALLGDGSSEAGAKRLDDFRVSIRKHKGSDLARGKFSANARRPEKYLSGGRV